MCCSVTSRRWRWKTFPASASAAPRKRWRRSTRTLPASVSDIRLHGIDGLALLTRLKQRDPSLPVVLITGHGDIGMAVSAMRDGAYDFVEKPFSPKRLVDVARRALEQRSLAARSAPCAVN